MSKKEEIVNKAIELFASEGYEGTSIQRLAEVSGVSQGLLYRHFKNKNDLLRHLLHTGLAQVAQSLAPYDDPSLDFYAACVEHIRRTCSLLIEHTTLWKVLHNVRHIEGIMSATGLEVDLRAVILKPIKRKLKQAGFKDTELMAWFIFGNIEGMVSLYLLHPHLYPLSKMKKMLINKINDYADQSRP